jgi:putative alpha-1,2-mannosidase
MNPIPYHVQFFCLTVILSGLSCKVSAQQLNHVRYVNPFIGTGKSNVRTTWGNRGGTYPGAVAPSGEVQLSPETRISNGRGYDYSDSIIYYFSCFGHASGYPNGSSGDLYIMPVATVNNFKLGKYNRHFSHTNEVAHPGYYKVTFDDHTIVEATATKRTGMFKFTFPSNIVPQIFIGDVGKINLVSKKILNVSRANAVIIFSNNYIKKSYLKDGIAFTFSPSETGEKVITLKISKSTVGYSGAKKNINKEIGKLDFDELYKKTKKQWARKLSVVDIIDSNEQNKIIFYTALYHSLLVPWVIDDADGRYRGHDGKIYQKSGKDQYGEFSPWDTFRSLNPLLSLLYPTKENDIILSLLDIYKQTGKLPAGPMTGNHAIPIIVDSYLKGITGFDKNIAYAAMKKSIMDTTFMQADMKTYQKIGYVPDNYPESVTRTVEYAYDDWALSQFSRYVIHNVHDYKLLHNRSYNYRNLFNTQELLLLPRHKQEFNLHPNNAGYKEGNKWIYSYFVPQNGKDLINLMGGRTKFTQRLDSAFSKHLILFDNETAFDIPYLFDEAGYPSLTQKWVRSIMHKRYSDSPGGLPGNGDLGAMSSWYIFSAMGIYPLCPGRPLYAIGSPLFRKIVLNLSNGKKFIINSDHSSENKPFVQSLAINNKYWHRLTIPHSLLLKGGSTTFTMGKNPSKWPPNKDPTDLSETKGSPSFKVLCYSVKKKYVKPDEVFLVHFSLINSGSLGTKTIKLLVNSKQYASKNILIGSGQVKEDSIKCRLYSVGKDTLRIKGLTPFHMYVKPLIITGDNNLFKIIHFTMKPLVKKNKKQQIKYTIQNIGGYRHNFHIPVMINDSMIYTDITTLDAGAKKNLHHAIIARRNGINVVKVDSFIKRFKVYNSPLETVLLDLRIDSSAENIVKDRSGFENNGYTLKTDSGDNCLNNGRFLFGKDCYVKVKNSKSLDQMGTTTITMMAWVYPTVKKRGLVGILTKGDKDVIQVSGGHTLSFHAGGWGRGSCKTRLPKDWVNHWHHITGVCNGKKLYLYIDGTLKKTTALQDTVNLSNTDGWYIGRNEEYPSSRIFNGYIDNVKVFEAPLTQSEINSIIEREKPAMKR